LGATSAGKEISNMVGVLPATTTVAKSCLVTSGSPIILITGNNTVDGWFIGTALSGTGIPANAVVQTIDPDGRRVSMSTGPGVAGAALNATASGGVSLTERTSIMSFSAIGRSFRAASLKGGSMALAQRLTIAGLSAINAQAITGTVADSLTATGATQATALALAGDINRFTTVAAATGALCPAMNPGDYIEVFNGGANALLVYPPTGAKINALGTNAGYSVATATPYVRVRCITPLQYIANQAA
jgi:hypothetical protein